MRISCKNLYALIIALLALGFYVEDASSNTKIEEKFLSKFRELAEYLDLPTSELGRGEYNIVSKNRREFYSQVGELVYAIVAYRAKAKKAPKSMGMLCNAALARKYKKKYAQEIRSHPIDRVLEEEILELSLNETLLSRVTKFSGGKESGWHYYGCRVRDEYIVPVDVNKRLTHFVAKVNYRNGKKSVQLGEYEKALDYFKKTNGNVEFYKNALAFIVPILSTIDMALSDRLDRELFELEEVNDPEALIYFGEYKLLGSSYEKSKQAFERCLELFPKNRECESSLSHAEKTIEIQEREEALKFDMIVN